MQEGFKRIYSLTAELITSSPEAATPAQRHADSSLFLEGVPILVGVGLEKDKWCVTVANPKGLTMKLSFFKKRSTWSHV